MTVPHLSENARRVLEARYLKRDASRRIIESPEQLFERVARAVAEAELLLGGARRAAHWEEQFYRMLTSLDFLPNSTTLMDETRNPWDHCVPSRKTCPTGPSARENGHLKGRGIWNDGTRLPLRPPRV